ncbi:hypothetical protein KY349_02970 [Candidatus Woesearchaeota archaeon]|nr:hypothetical protein [Candidatus Woesearchaeota archaeon]
MTVHHVMQEDEQKHVCAYCGKRTDPRKWMSTFEGTAHYKELKCTCGRKVTVKVPFMGSGDDSWGKNLDNRVEDEEEDPKSQKE